MDVFWLARMFEGYSQGEEMLKLGQEVNMRNRYHSKYRYKQLVKLLHFQSTSHEMMAISKSIALPKMRISKF